MAYPEVVDIAGLCGIKSLLLLAIFHKVQAIDLRRNYMQRSASAKCRVQGGNLQHDTLASSISTKNHYTCESTWETILKLTPTQ